METNAAPFRNSIPEQTCFVYDVATGDVVHIHQFCPAEPGGRCSEAEMEKAALELAVADSNGAKVAAFHHSGELKLMPGNRYRMDRARKAVESYAIKAMARHGQRKAED